MRPSRKGSSGIWGRSMGASEGGGVEAVCVLGRNSRQYKDRSGLLATTMYEAIRIHNLYNEKESKVIIELRFLYTHCGWGLAYLVLLRDYCGNHENFLNQMLSLNIPLSNYACLVRVGPILYAYSLLAEIMLQPCGTRKVGH